MLKRYLKDRIAKSRKVLGISYDCLFRNATGYLTVDVPEFEGCFQIDVRSHILRRILVNGEYEPAVTAFVSQNIDPRRDAIDVGANIGFFTVKMLAAGARRVLAVEPMPVALHYLKQNISNNGRSSQAVVYAGAVGAACGEVTMNYIPGKEEYSSIDPLDHPAIKGLPSDSLSVPVRTLDELVEEYKMDPAIIKLDTEGSEHRILAGARTVLRKHRPVLVMENWGENQTDVRRILADCKYEIRGLSSGTNVGTPC